MTRTQRMVAQRAAREARDGVKSNPVTDRHCKTVVHTVRTGSMITVSIPVGIDPKTGKRRFMKKEVPEAVTTVRTVPVKKVQVKTVGLKSGIGEQSAYCWHKGFK